MILNIENALVVDDDLLMREFVVETLTRSGIHVTQAGNGLEAKQLLAEKKFDLVFLDLKMPGIDGMQVLQHMRETGVESLTVIVTAFGTVEKAVEAMKLGAYDFLMKPFSPEQVEIIIKRAREWVELHAQNAYLQEELGWHLAGGRQIVGQAAAMTALMGDVAKVARSSSTVLICGESGTGKELVAHAIHTLSDRKEQPFIRLNCAAVPETLMDSELFGHEKGAFTSAITTRLGRFELANRGTLLLDEISEMPLGVQAKLLRVLQEREFERVGGGRTIKTDCRIMATTNRDLKSYVAEGKFRQDLYYRLNVVPLRIPPLRERPDDIPLLVDAFLQKYGLRRAEVRDWRLDDAAMRLLRGYAWPGNVRELEHLVERLCVMEDGPVITAHRLPAEISGAAPASLPDNAEPPSSATPPAAAAVEDEVFSLPEIERQTIMRALEHTGGNRTRCAELLNVSIRTLRNKLKEYGVTGKSSGS